ncbi:hypothetical protein GCM10009099_06790 [Caenispirillum bisanense]
MAASTTSAEVNPLVSNKGVVVCVDLGFAMLVFAPDPFPHPPATVAVPLLFMNMGEGEDAGANGYAGPVRRL